MVTLAATRQDMIDQRYIVARRHKSEPLSIFNYTARAAVDRMWNEITLTCRGLVVHDDGRVIARPYRKFFNLGQSQAEPPDRFVVADKLDGSLGISYREPSTGRIAIATRGSFESEQAIHATERWHALYPDVQIPEGQTWLFEIVYPTTKANRHVLDYGDLDDLILHGVIDIATGADLPMPSPLEWPGPVVETWAPVPIDQLPVRENAEGYVLVEDPLPTDRPARRVKIKFADYERLHKLLDGITPKRIWACLKSSGDLKAVLEGAPGEQFQEALDIADSLRRQFREIEHDVIDRLGTIRAEFANRMGREPEWTPTRKDFAIRFSDERDEIRPLLFLMLSDKGAEFVAKCWDKVEP